MLFNVLCGAFSGTIYSISVTRSVFPLKRKERPPHRKVLNNVEHSTINKFTIKRQRHH